MIQRLFIFVISNKHYPYYCWIVLMAASYLTGSLNFPGASATDEQMRPFAGAIAMPTIIAYLWYALISIHDTAVDSFNQLAENIPEEQQKTKKKRFLQTAIRNTAISIALSLLATFSYLYSEDLLAFDGNIVSITMNLMAIPFWFFIFFFIVHTVSLNNIATQEYLTKDSIDIMGIEKLAPVSKFVVNNTVKAAIIFVLIPLFWIGRQIPKIDIILTCLLLLGITFYLFMPVFKAQRIIAHKKAMAIQRIYKKLNDTMEENICGGRRITDNPRTLRRIACLIAAKTEIAKVREWPVDVPQSLKVIAVTAAAPLSMVAGSLVDYALSQFNLFGL